MTDTIKAALLGVAVGDALGVPVEFMNREELQREPVTDMRAFGTHYQPAGTFSDDASLTFCLAEALTHEFDINIIAHNFVRWAYEGYWSAHGKVFDIGIATQQAIEKLARGVEPELAGGRAEAYNGNGSLMRILPLVFYITDKSIKERYEITRQVSSLTHGHVRSVIACFYYLEFARLLIKGLSRQDAYDMLKTEIPEYLKSLGINPDEISLFNRLLVGNIYDITEDNLQSSGYVVHTLEAAIWCLFKGTNYKEAVLKAVNLGSDTDTTTAVTGGLAALYYGVNNIPQQWLTILAKRAAIENLADRLAKRHILQPYDFKATLKYKTTEEGGRETAATSGYRPQIKFSFDERTTSGIQIFEDRDMVYPGETINAAVKMITPHFFENSLRNGMEFQFCEGNRIIGTGSINQIINISLKATSNQ